ncbi:nucleotide-diphospho-sugar transferases superfamily protein [Actinidia rufa]|uniref:glucomannan 4-beta-mannosyltransferase n=2 Tax=Magnoliopsida TaxID=3398 RepID=A0A7J0E8K1_9ERIC|nr:nucleotide-diphospho-sugar transferases superfamily protein [Actinidia rufa]
MDRISSTTLLPDSFAGARDDITEQIVLVWGQIKAPLIVPLLRLAILLFSEEDQRKRYRWEPIKDDLEVGNLAYPMVLVQIPMYNEKEVYQLSIGAACGLSWPSDRIIIQVLDDSTDPIIKDMVELECQRWASKGINIKYEIRDNRNGYKAGALKEGMKREYVKQCDYVAIFDADFQPEPDFLWRTIPFLLHNPELALVQARWKFVNSDECLMTRMQEMSLDYHFTVEQEVGSSTYAFFGFNGTAGVWRIAAINEAGGWKDRTTVEDMDLAVRASLKGWKFLYLGSLKVKNELPSTFKAYRYQQHRWSCGPANLFRKMAMEIITNNRVTMWKKVHVIYSFFMVRKIVAHIVTFVFYCVVLPATVLVPEVEVPKWAAVYIPSIITILNAVGTPRSLHLLVFWILFENVMSLHRTKATFIGLLEAGRVNEWIVTEKLGMLSRQRQPPRRIKGLGSGSEKEFICWSLAPGFTSSSAAATTLPLGKTITSSTYLSKQWPSSSLGSVMLARLSPTLSPTPKPPPPVVPLLLLVFPVKMANRLHVLPSNVPTLYLPSSTMSKLNPHTHHQTHKPSRPRPPRTSTKAPNPPPTGEKRIEDARNLFEEMSERRVLANCVTYNTLIDGYCKVGILEEAVKVRERMKAENVEPNLLLLIRCLVGYIGHGRWRKQRNCWRRWKVEGLPRMDYLIVYFLTGIRGASGLRKWAEKGAPPNLQTYNTLIDGYGRSCQFESCFLILEEMENNVLKAQCCRGILPNAQIYHILINSHCTAGKLKDAFRFLDEMLRKEIVPTVVTYNAFIHGLCKKNRVAEAEELNGYLPDIGSCNELVSGLRKQGRLQETHLICSEMSSKGIDDWCTDDDLSAVAKM